MADNNSTAIGAGIYKNRSLRGPAQDDLTGRDSMLWNVLASWAGQFVFLLAGFVMPRVIDHHIGQAALGIWDFSWSIVSYFGLANLGVGSSVNRYVARYRAVNDINGLKTAVSSILVFQVVAAILVTAVTPIVVYGLPIFFGERLGIETESAQYVVAFLGAGVAVQLSFDVFRGVMTGCHRWDLHNAVNSGYYLLTTVVMIVVLMAGQGLRGLALVYLIGVIFAELTRFLMALRICPELKIGLKYVQWKETREMISFGFKRVMVGIPGLIVLQGTGLLIAGNLGPEALAVFSRPLALVRNVEVFIDKFAMVLTPTTGSLQSSGHLEDIAEMLIKSTRTAAYLALPILIFFIFLGDSILTLWMGPRYEEGLILSILSIGFFLHLTQHSVMSILTGMNHHGQIGFFSLVVTLCSFALSAFWVGSLGWTLAGAAIVIGIPLTLGNGVVVSVLGCLKLKIPLKEFVIQVFKGPIFCTLPFALSLALCRKLYAGKPTMELAVGVLFAIGLLGPLYWHYVIPATVRQKILDLLCRRTRRPLF